MPVETIKVGDEEVTRFVFPMATTGTEAGVREADPPEAIIPGACYRGHTTILSGAPKAGKTTLIRDWIRTIGKAHDSVSQHSHFMLHDRMVKASRVLVFSEEAPYQWDSFFADMRQEGICRAASDGGENVADFEWCRIYDRRHRGIAPATPVERLLWIEAVIEMVKAMDIDLVIIDPVTRFLALASENDNAEVLNALVQLERVATEGECGLLMLHHTGKSGGQARGASAFLQNPDVLLTLRRAREEEDVDMAPDQDEVRILTGTGRFPEIEEIVACWRTDEDGFMATTTVEKVRKMTQNDTDADAILTFISREQPAREMLEAAEYDGISGAEIREETGLSQVRMHRAVRLLISKNAIFKRGTTRNARYHLT